MIWISSRKFVFSRPTMLVSDFDYELPERLIAQEPPATRDSSRVLIVDRAGGELVDSVFSDLPDHLRAGDLLVLNNTRVFPARLIGRRLRVTPRGDTVLGGRVQIFLVSRIQPLVWEALVRPGRSLLPGARVEVARGKLTAEVIEWREGGRRLVRFEAGGDFDEIIDRIGRTPLPPYIKRDEEDRLDAERYQTVFARKRGAVAAPTAGLHFTPELLGRLHAGTHRLIALEPLVLRPSGLCWSHHLRSSGPVFLYEPVALPPLGQTRHRTP